MGYHDLDASGAVLGRTYERVEERDLLLLVAAGREHLLELIHDEHRAMGWRRQRPL